MPIVHECRSELHRLKRQAADGSALEWEFVRDIWLTLDERDAFDTKAGTLQLVVPSKYDPMKDIRRRNEKT